MKTTAQILPWLFATAVLYLLQYAGFAFGYMIFNHWYWGLATAFGINALLTGYLVSVWKDT